MTNQLQFPTNKLSIFAGLHLRRVGGERAMRNCCAQFSLPPIETPRLFMYKRRHRYSKPQTPPPTPKPKPKLHRILKPMEICLHLLRADYRQQRFIPFRYASQSTHTPNAQTQPSLKPLSILPVKRTLSPRKQPCFDAALLSSCKLQAQHYKGVSANSPQHPTSQTNSQRIQTSTNKHCGKCI